MQGATTDLRRQRVGHGLALALTGLVDFLIGLVGFVGLGAGLAALGEDLEALALVAGLALTAGFALAVGLVSFLGACEALDLLLLAEVLATDLEVGFVAGLAMRGGGLKDDLTA